MPNKCIYCPADLDDTTEIAHVFPAALGGRLRSTTYCCTSCNHHVSPLESELCDRLREMSAMVGGVDRHNKPVTAVVEHGGRLWHASNGRLVAKAPAPHREGKQLVIPMAADGDEQVRRLASILRKRNWPPEALLDGRFTLEPGEPEPPPPVTSVEGKVPLGDVVTKRAIVKIAVELVGYFDVALARHGALSETRRFVKHGSGVPLMKLEKWTDGSGLWNQCNRNWDAVAFRHSVEVWTFARALHYRVTLFSFLHFGGLLGSGFDQKFAALYVFDVRKPANRDLICEPQDGFAPPICTVDVDVEHLAAAEQQFEDRTKRLFGETPRYSRAQEPDAQDLYERVKAAMTTKEKG